MWITGDVELPQAVLDAQSEGRLVFFVGAGASVAAPSNLPLFDGLARQLADMARVPHPEKDAALDLFLGSMPDNFDTHRHARDLIDRGDSKPNTTHLALVRLAAAIGPLRIVTTNFDDHLASAASSEGIAIPDKWIGPALPLGHDFVGLVHLHGSVRRHSRELVLTDRDFGRAYLTYAWATRFLLPMFQQFTVLFVGYSHDDPIMRYLALGLPSKTQRYAFTSVDKADDPKWDRLAVTTITYPANGQDHNALVAALDAWNVRARMGQLDHQARTREIISAGPTLTPVDRDYLISRVRTVDGAREFAQSTSAVDTGLQVAWLHWIEQLPEFKALFMAKEESEASALLGNWFCQTFIMSPELHGAALQTVQRLGRSFTAALFRSAIWAADQLSSKDAAAGERWKVFLTSSVPGHSAPVELEGLLSSSPGDRAEHIAIIRAALRPFLSLKRRWFLDEAEHPTTIPDAEVHWNAEDHFLQQNVLKFVEAMPHGDPEVSTALEDALSAAYALQEAYHGEREWDPLNRGRSAIEPHQQDQFRDPVDAVLDGLRRYGERALPARPDLPERWWALGRALFRRLALHLLALETGRSADQKIVWLLERVTPYEAGLKHEIYRVLATAIGDLSVSEETRQRLLATVQTGPSYPEDMPDHDRHAAYAIYNLLVWLTRAAPDWSDAASALAALQAENLKFAPREHPDFDSWFSSGTWDGKLPMEPEEFIQSFDEDPAAAVDELLAYDYSEHNFDEPAWSDALSLVSQVVVSKPGLGEPIWALIDVRLDSDARAHDLRRAIIEGWSKTSLGEVTDAAVARVGTQVTNPELARSVSRFLLEHARRHIESHDTPALASMRLAALDLWREQSSSFSHSQSMDPVSIAPLYLNSWPGDLTQFWLSEVDRRWRKQRTSWTGFNSQERDALIQLLSGSPHTLDATLPAMASEVYFMFAADPSFTTAHILPLFQRDTTAALSWSAFLHHPRYNDKLLAAGLLDSTIEEWGRVDALGQNGLKNQFFGLVASIVSFAGITADARQALLDQSVLARDGAFAEEFAEAVSHFLRTGGIAGAEVWKLWLEDHLVSRLDGIPRTASAEELARWADTVPYLGEAIPESIELFTGHSIGLGDRYWNAEFPEGALAANGPALVAHFAERIDNSSPSNYSVVYHVNQLILEMRNELGKSMVQPLVNAARERGFLNGETD